MLRWYRVCPASDLPPGGARSIQLFGRPFAVFNIDGDLFGIDGACRHMKANLAAGRIEGATVECFMHQWRYDVRTGKCLSNDHGDVKTFPTKTENNEIWIGVEWPLTNA